jgi:hypothetical protein
MDTEIYQYGIVGVALIYALEKGYLLFKGVLARYNPPDEKSPTDMLAKISGNDLSHILKAIETQTTYTREDHQKQIELLTKISTILEMRLK